MLPCSFCFSKQHGSTTDSCLRFGLKCAKSPPPSRLLRLRRRDQYLAVAHGADSHRRDLVVRVGRYRSRTIYCHYEVGIFLTCLTSSDNHAALGARRTSSTSTTTINQLRSSRDPLRTDTPTGEGKEQRWDSFGRRPSFTRREQPPPSSLLRSPPLQEEDLTSSSSEESEDEDDTKQAPRFKRFGKFSTHGAGLRNDEDEDDDDYTPAFLPLGRESQPTSRERPIQEPSATLRLEEQRRRSTEQQPTPRIPVTSESSASSVSSGVAANLPQGEIRRPSQARGTLGPHQHGEVPRRSPRKSTASGREASDGTPSMGSSFSDLDGK